MHIILLHICALNFKLLSWQIKKVLKRRALGPPKGRSTAHRRVFNNLSSPTAIRPGIKRASRRFLHARMQTVRPSFHDPLSAYPWPLSAIDAFSNPLFYAIWVRFVAGNRPFGPCWTVTQVEDESWSRLSVQSKELDTIAFLLNLAKFSRIWGGGGLIFYVKTSPWPFSRWEVPMFQISLQLVKNSGRL